MNSPLPAAMLSMTYLYLIKVVGPRFMANRPAYELRGVLMVYNVFQIVFNGWIFYELGRSGWFQGTINIFCQPIDFSETDPDAMRMVTAGYWFYISKFVDFFDTFFFVLRKRTRQITVLHLVHHAILPVSLWPGIRFASGGHASFFALLNSLVHVIIYFYYLVAAMGPRFEKYVRWKRHLTNCQIAQFVAASVHCFQLVFKNECGFPAAFYWWIGGHEILFLCLFIHFYKDAYLKKKQKKNETNTSDSGTHKKQH